MAGKSRLAVLNLTVEEKQRLDALRHSRSASLRTVERANILWHYHAGLNPSEIKQAAKVSRVTVYACLRKALAMGLEAGRKDAFHRPKEPRIDHADKAWVVHLACTKPKDLGYAAELWTRRALAAHVRQHAAATAHPNLARAAKSTVQKILAQEKLPPHKLKYYLEKRDPEFEAKMKEVLIVYQEVLVQNRAAELAAESGAGGVAPAVITVSVDEKPGVQALAHTAPDLPPVAGKHARVARDYEYKRCGTLSILAALDLHDGHVVARVESRHRSREFVALLKDLDAYYPPAATLRVILDNHSAHLSKETRAYLATRPNRFQYVHTPKHGSWLNLVETLFGKMARTFRRHIRVASKAELKERILLGYAHTGTDWAASPDRRGFLWKCAPNDCRESRAGSPPAGNRRPGP